WPGGCPAAAAAGGARCGGRARRRKSRRPATARGAGAIMTWPVPLRHVAVWQPSSCAEGRLLATATGLGCRLRSLMTENDLLTRYRESRGKYSRVGKLRAYHVPS